MLGLRIALWILGGVVGSVAFWLFQTLMGGGTITAFMGEQIVATGGYPEALAPWVGWAVHLGVSLDYAFLVALVALFLRAVPAGLAVVASLVVAVVLGWITNVIAPPAISVTISLLGGQGWPGELYPLNSGFGPVFWNHVIFFLLNWVIQVVAPRLGGQT